MSQPPTSNAAPTHEAPAFTPKKGVFIALVIGYIAWIAVMVAWALQLRHGH